MLAPRNRLQDKLLGFPERESKRERERESKREKQKHVKKREGKHPKIEIAN